MAEVTSCLIVGAVAILLYSNSLFGEFVFDDHEAIETNPDVRSDTPLSTVFSNDFWGLPLSHPDSHKSYRPLTVLTFRWNRALHGLERPSWFHVTNVALHALVCVLYHLLLRRCLGLARSLSLSASLLFACHPIHTEAVSSIVGRAELLSAVFFLLSFMAYSHSISSHCNWQAHGAGGDGSNSASGSRAVGGRGLQQQQQQPSLSTAASWLWVVLSVLLSVVSLLCKEQGVTVLGVCLAYDVFVVCGVDGYVLGSVLKQLKEAHSHNEGLKRIPRWALHLFKRCVVLTLSAVTLVVWRVVVIGGGSPVFMESDNPALFSPSLQTRVLTYAYLWSQNAWFLLCPSLLCYDWSMGSIPLVESVTDWRNLSTCCFATAVALLVHRALFHSAYSYHTGLGGEENLTELEPEAEGPTTTTTTTTTTTAARRIRRREGERRDTKTPALLQARVPLATSTAVRATSGRCLTLFAVALAAITFLPASNVLVPVGFVLAERVLYLPSMGHCLLVSVGLQAVDRCLSSPPPLPPPPPPLASSSPSSSPLSFSASGTKNYIKAQAAVDRRSSWGRWKWSCSSLLLASILLSFSAKVLVRNSEWRGTAELAAAGLRVNPGNPKIHLTMGNYLAQQGNRSCELYYREALRLRPGYPTAWTNLGLVLLNTDRPREAEESYLRALSIKPDHISANTNMGHLCKLQGRWAESSSYYEKALERRPDSPLLLYNLGLVSERLGTVEGLQRAEGSFSRALQLQPNYQEAHVALARLLATTGADGARLEYGYSKGNRLKNALSHFSSALSLNPKDVDARYELARILRAEGKVAEATSHLQTVLNLSPDHSLARMELGYIKGL